MNTTKASFVGRISTSKNAANAAFQVKLYILDDRIDIISVDGEEWSWKISDVTMTRVAVGRYELQLADEHLYFLPVDARGFQRHVIDAGVQEDRSSAGWLRRRIEAAQASDEPAVGYDLDVAIESPEMDSPGRRKHVHEWVTGSAVGVRTRRCVSCNRVSIDATGLVSNLAATDEAEQTRQLSEVLSSLHVPDEPELVAAQDPWQRG